MELLNDDDYATELDGLAAAIQWKLGYVELIIAKRKLEGLDWMAANLAVLDESKRAMDIVRSIVQRIREQEEAHLVKRIRESEEDMEYLFVIALFSKVVMGVILVALFVLIWREMTCRYAAQAALAVAHAELEERIRERTVQLSDANARLTVLSRNVLGVQENERQRIARDLHDEIGQALTAINLNLRNLQDDAGSAASASLVSDCLSLLKSVIGSVRNLAINLRPSLLDELGFGAAAKWYLQRQAERAGWRGSFAATNWSDEMPEDAAITCFRILQEALNNIAKHAAATAVDVRISRDASDIVLEIQDNGCGFDVARARQDARFGHSVGLLAMEERAHLVGGVLTIASNVSEGTMIKVSLPCVATHAALAQPSFVTG